MVEPLPSMHEALGSITRYCQVKTNKTPSPSLYAKMGTAESLGLKCSTDTLTAQRGQWPMAQGNTSRVQIKSGAITTARQGG